MARRASSRLKKERGVRETRGDREGAETHGVVAFDAGGRDVQVAVVRADELSGHVPKRAAARERGRVRPVRVPGLARLGRARGGIAKRFPGGDGPDMAAVRMRGARNLGPINARASTGSTWMGSLAVSARAPSGVPATL